MKYAIVLALLLSGCAAHKQIAAQARIVYVASTPKIVVKIMRVHEHPFIPKKDRTCAVATAPPKGLSTNAVGGYIASLISGHADCATKLRIVMEIINGTHE
jgi:hypothetical protein